MIKKYTHYALMMIVLCSVGVASLRSLRVSAQQSPPVAGCGAYQGPALPGTYCTQDQLVYADSTLPYGCPGSTEAAPAGGLPADYGTYCDARPGRSTCTFSFTQNTCPPVKGFAGSSSAGPPTPTAPGSSTPQTGKPGGTATPSTPSSGGQSSGTNISTPDDPTRANACGQLTNKAPEIKCIKECDTPGPADCLPVNPGCSSNTYSVNSGCGIVQRYINPLIRFLSAGFGIIVAIMIAIGGLQYATAGGDPQKVAAGKKRIFNAIFALIAFGLLATFLNFIIPGGLGA